MSKNTQFEQDIANYEEILKEEQKAHQKPPKRVKRLSKRKEGVKR